MAVHSDTTPLASFEGKWTATHPELGLALTFVPAPSRNAQAAFACLAFEMEYAAFGIREREPAAIKLQWWAEEFARAREGEARHPLTQALTLHSGFADIRQAQWHAVVAGAFAQHDPEPASDCATLLRGFEPFYNALATVEAQLFASVDADARTRLHALSRALRDTAALAEDGRDDRLPLPLELLARHRLARGDLMHDSAQRHAALRDWLQALGAEYEDLGAVPARVGILGHTVLHADRWRIRNAVRAADPLAQLTRDLARLPLGSAWAAWRAARRSSRGR